MSDRILQLNLTEREAEMLYGCIGLALSEMSLGDHDKECAIAAVLGMPCASHDGVALPITLMREHYAETRKLINLLADHLGNFTTDYHSAKIDALKPACISTAEANKQYISAIMDRIFTRPAQEPGASSNKAEGR